MCSPAQLRAACMRRPPCPSPAPCRAGKIDSVSCRCSPPPLEKGRSASEASRVGIDFVLTPTPTLPLSGGGSPPVLAATLSHKPLRPERRRVGERRRPRHHVGDQPPGDRPEG